jgi:hypothetical protein
MRQPQNYILAFRISDALLPTWYLYVLAFTRADIQYCCLHRLRPAAFFTALPLIRTILLMAAAVLIAGLVTLIAFLCTQQFRSWNRLRHVPGPFWASVSSLWMVQKGLTGRLHEHLRDLSEKYGAQRYVCGALYTNTILGPLVRIGPNEVLSTDPRTLRMVSAARSPYTKGVFYETGRICHGEDNVVSLRNEVAHKALRAKMSSAVSTFPVPWQLVG